MSHQGEQAQTETLCVYYSILSKNTQVYVITSLCLFCLLIILFMVYIANSIQEEYSLNLFLVIL
jgi:hypothetical protein